MPIPRDTRRRGAALRSGATGAALGAAAARATYTLLARLPRRDPVDDVFTVGEHSRDVWTRTNFRGVEVTLLEGPALAAGVGAGILLAPGLSRRYRAAALLAACGAAGFGGYADLSGSAASRGFAGHLRALARGEVTTGAVRAAGIGATGLTAAALLGGRTTTPVDVLVNGGLIAGTAHLVTLLDVRPGRAAKVGLIAGAPALAGPGSGAAGPALGAAAALLPEDLAERAMLGDSGANTLGAALGVAAAVSLPRPARAGLLAAVAGVTVAGEVVSLSRVVDRVPPLRWLDGLGRRPAPAPGPVPPEAPLPGEPSARVSVPAQRGPRTPR